jgi:hypothetical protein
MSAPEIKLTCVSNVWTRLMHFVKAGDIEQGHTHPFDHVTLLSSGSVRVTVNGVESEFKAPALIFIKAESVHRLEALEDNTVAACIHALRDGYAVEDIIDPDGLPAGVTPERVALAVVGRHPQWQQEFVK